MKALGGACRRATNFPSMSRGTLIVSGSTQKIPSRLSSIATPRSPETMPTRNGDRSGDGEGGLHAVSMVPVGGRSSCTYARTAPQSETFPAGSVALADQKFSAFLAASTWTANEPWAFAMPSAASVPSQCLPANTRTVAPGSALLTRSGEASGLGEPMAVSTVGAGGAVPSWMNETAWAEHGEGFPASSNARAWNTVSLSRSTRASTRKRPAASASPEYGSAMSQPRPSYRTTSDPAAAVPAIRGVTTILESGPGSTPVTSGAGGGTSSWAIRSVSAAHSEWLPTSSTARAETDVIWLGASGTLARNSPAASANAFTAGVP